MKFEKFLKSVGTHGEVIARNESEKWLVCGGVGMVIPKGVDNLLGTSTNFAYGTIVDVISKLEYEDPVVLDQAVLLEADGKASDIYRIFVTEDNLDEDDFYEVAITNGAYGLLEKKDLLAYFEVEIDCDENGNPIPAEQKRTIKYLLVFDPNREIVGFITGSQHF